MVTLSDCVFVWMQREFAPRLGVCERELQPATPLDRFLPPERRREFWRVTERELELRLPTLVLPPRIERTAAWFIFGSAARGALWGLLLGAKWLAIPMAIGSLVIAIIAVERFSRPWATEHPDLRTFGDLSRWLLGRNMKKFRHLFGLEPTHDEIFATLKVMLVEMGADPDKITPESMFDELLPC